MRAFEPEVIIVGEEELPEIPLAPTQPPSRWMSRSLGGAATVLVHLLLSAPLVLGVAAHKTRTPDGPGSVAWASQGEQSESMILLDLSSAATLEFDTPAPQINSEGITPDQFRIELVSSEPQPPAELKPEEFEEAEVANEAAGDSTGNAALFGRYMGQVAARIERAWLRPRSAVEGGHFDCRVRITQDQQGNVESIEFQTCGSDLAWRKSLTSAILRASPLSAPPEPWLFTPTVSLNFSGEQYVASHTPEYAYEPVITRVAMAKAPAQLFREEVGAAAEKAAPQGGDVELTIVGTEVSWTPKDSSVATPR